MKWIGLMALGLLVTGCVTHVRKFGLGNGVVRLEVVKKEGPVDSFPLGGRESPYNFYFVPKNGQISTQDMVKITRGFPPDHEQDVPKADVRGSLMWDEKAEKVRINIEHRGPDGQFAPIEINGKYSVSSGSK